MKVKLIEALEEEYWRGFRDGQERTRGIAEWLIETRKNGTYQFFCSNCGDVNVKTSTFCPNCGRMMMREKNECEV